MTLKQLQEAHAKDPDDAEVAAQLAEHFYHVQGKKKEATELAEKVLRAKGKHPLAAAVKAASLREAGKLDLAISLLETNVDDKTTEPRALRLLARMQKDTKKFAEAAHTYEQGRKSHPGDPSWLFSLAELYEKNVRDEAKLADVQKDIAKMDADDLVVRRKLCRSLLSQGKLADAEVYARQVLEIDVLDSEGQEVLLQALTRQNKDEQVKQLKKLLEK